MARYDREFLVPYLQDICALYMAKDKISSYIWNCEEEINTIKVNARRSIPQPKLEPPASESTGLFVGGLGLLLTFIALILFISVIGAPIGIIIGIPGVLCLSYFKSAKERENQAIDSRNQAKTKAWEEKVRIALANEEGNIQRINQAIQFYELEMERIDQLLEQAYSVNIISRWYREKYPMFYLYDWFSNGRSDDLDMALNTFVLEEIKDRLDTLIRLEAEKILNQRIMIANQYKSMEQQERHNAMLCAKLDQIATSNEDRNMYLGMIEANTAANAYFSAASYFRK